jgi:hypothetical protein
MEALCTKILVRLGSGSYENGSKSGTNQSRRLQKPSSLSLPSQPLLEQYQPSRLNWHPEQCESQPQPVRRCPDERKGNEKSRD